MMPLLVEAISAEAHDLPPVVAEHHHDKQHPEPDGLDPAEVDGDEVAGVVTEECPPGGGGRLATKICVPAPLLPQPSTRRAYCSTLSAAMVTSTAGTRARLAAESGV